MSKLDAFGIGVGLSAGILIVLLIALLPLCFLWGVNILLGVMALPTIPITLKSWFGAFLIGAALRVVQVHQK